MENKILQKIKYLKEKRKRTQVLNMLSSISNEGVSFSIDYLIKEVLKINKNENKNNV